MKPKTTVLFLANLLCTLSLAVPQRVSAEPTKDYSVREETVSMRDGVKLHTVIVTPRAVPGPMPILMERTPYDASSALDGHPSTRLAVALGNKFVGSDTIYVFQDIRGRYRSEGDVALYRVPRGAFNDTDTDETTDAWDTIDWLVKEVPTNNGRVGVWGTSYPGWLTLAAMRDPHPALAAAVPFNPVVDVWKADDWFHWGAFRATYAFDYIYEMETKRGESVSYPHEAQDIYAWFLSKGAAEPGLGTLLDGRYEMWTRIMESPSYGPYWKDVAADRWFESPSRLVPALHVHGLWDQEDIYGAPAVYAAIEKHDRENELNFFAAGPWYHGQHFDEGSRLGTVSFDEDTSKRFREDVLVPFLRRFLHGDDVLAPSPVTVFETGTNRWRRFDRWPPLETKKDLYLEPGGSLGWARPPAGDFATEYVSDPKKPVPYAPRPNWEINYGNPPALAAWRRWLVEDQRFVDGRPDVATWVSEPLEQPLTVRGPVTARVIAETTGTDADWVVKLIDVYPDDDSSFVKSGFQLMVSGDIFRGRYRESYEEPHAIDPGVPLEYTVPLPIVNHVFLPGHRLMVQVQSSWFPLYDRNPQIYVPSIMAAPESAYRPERHRIHHSAEYASRLELLVDEASPE